ncbi:polysaccharide biosynthesis protein [Halalkalibacillus halophilus]|uniref:polysaccharide biosynthesis protein n=1 Tax=Halalkalibacillus halophilus TaxID=392827 RepID=UPI000425DE42|nr:polysaccharide biosynthesis protein [Halalkalibacillus halophilus]
MGKNQDWIKGTVWIAVAAFIGKVLGLIYRIPLQNIAGDEGLYIYQQIYPILSLALLLSIYSLPSATAQLLGSQTKDPQVRRAYVSVVFYLYISLGVLAWVLLFFAAPLLSTWMGDEALTLPIRMSSFMFLLIPITATLRGYFQSEQRTDLIAISQVVEQLIRVLIIIATTVAVASFGMSLYMIGVYASMATVCGSVVASVLLFVWFKGMKQEAGSVAVKADYRKMFPVLFKAAIVFSFIHILHLLLQAVDVFTMIHMLQSWGASLEEARFLKGVYDRGNPLIQLGLVFGTAIAFALVPSLNETVEKEGIKEEERNFAVKLTAFISLQATVGLVAIMPYLNPLFYKSDDATLVLQVMVTTILPLSLVITISVILQQQGKKLVQLWWLLIWISLKVLLNLLLLPIYGIMGASIASITASIALLGIYFWVWSTISPSKVAWSYIFKLVTSSIVMLSLVLLAGESIVWVIGEANRLQLSIIITIQVLIGIAVVLLCMFYWKIWSKEELDRLWSMVPNKVKKRLSRANGKGL